MIGNGYSCSWGTVSRQGGAKKSHSAVGKAAYDCRLDLTDEIDATLNMELKHYGHYIDDPRAYEAHLANLEYAGRNSAGIGTNRKLRAQPLQQVRPRGSHVPSRKGGDLLPRPVSLGANNGRRNSRDGLRRVREEAQAVTTQKVRFDFSKRKDCKHYGTMLPTKAPQEWRDNVEALAKAMEKAETRINSQTAWTLRYALPVGLNEKELVQLTKNISFKTSAKLGLAGTWAIHDINGSNPHAHSLISTREVTAGGFGAKRRDLQEKKHLASVRQTVAHESATMLERAASTRTNPVDKAALKLAAERWWEGHKTLPEQAAAARKRGDTEFAEYCKERMAEEAKGKVVRLDVHAASHRRTANAERDRQRAEKARQQAQPSKTEIAKAQKFGVDLKAMGGAAATAFAQAKTHQEFRDSLRAMGYKLALSEFTDKKTGKVSRSFALVGKQGDVWSLGRTIRRSNPNISHKQIHAIVSAAALRTVDRELFWKNAVAESGRVAGRLLSGISQRLAGSSAGQTQGVLFPTTSPRAVAPPTKSPDKPYKSFADTIAPVGVDERFNGKPPASSVSGEAIAAADVDPLAAGRAAAAADSIMEGLGAELDAIDRDQRLTSDQKAGARAAVTARRQSEAAAARKRIMDDEQAAAKLRRAGLWKPKAKTLG